ncbi:phosphoadenylyl-sulfate reductase [Halalkalibacter akibai]|uniref:Adenosine 5'-phosphosulfate reductase n=1 Tax=Halalkalibacter akibai (strain ATCC 43226 / DSM 21942 / CIP 109018 / JCM 9157 / 1139) TaxID=1236973 RepID=W4QPC2_HALA3|nr:phosphoadenylyl-sulfate reductase [Halalkalibacter akibai]GAE33508.1 phosphoadenylyl-sulfate reductase [Halalkalibacter akibai JCM 9157]
MKLNYNSLQTEDYQAINKELERKDSLEVLKWAYNSFGDKLVYSCSFGAEGMVLIDLISKVKKDATIVFLDTDFHFKETYELIDKVKARYPSLNIELAKPEITPEQQAEKHGDRLWERDPDACCNVRKLVPLQRELDKYNAWISGLRREQSPTRVNTQFVNQDNRFKSIKVCPLIHWTEEEIWMYIKLHKLPYNDLHDKSYPSIGCEYCTKPVAEGGDPRSGRWANSEKTECGLHK